MTFEINKNVEVKTEIKEPYDDEELMNAIYGLPAKKTVNIIKFEGKPFKFLMKIQTIAEKPNINFGGYSTFVSGFGALFNEKTKKYEEFYPTTFYAPTKLKVLLQNIGVMNQYEKVIVIKYLGKVELKNSRNTKYSQHEFAPIKFYNVQATIEQFNVMAEEKADIEDLSK